MQAGLQIGAHGGMRLTQCKSVRLVTTKTIPMQVDGEPCRLQPSVILIHLRNQANMIQRSKRSNNTPSPLNESVSLSYSLLRIISYFSIFVKFVLSFGISLHEFIVYFLFIYYPFYYYYY